MLPYYLVKKNINVRKQAINDIVQTSAATYLRWDGVVNNQIKKDLLPSLSVKKVKSVNIWQSYKQDRGCLVGPLLFRVLMESRTIEILFFVRLSFLWYHDIMTIDQIQTTSYISIQILLT